MRRRTARATTGPPAAGARQPEPDQPDHGERDLRVGPVRRAVREHEGRESYANFYKLLLGLRPNEEHRLLHVLSNLTRQCGLRNRVVALIEQERIPLARSEVRSCGWLAHIDEHGGSIFAYRPRAKGAEDIERLTEEVLAGLEEPVAHTA